MSGGPKYEYLWQVRCHWHLPPNIVRQCTYSTLVRNFAIFVGRGGEVERREVDISVHAGWECTVIRFVSISAKFAICTVVNLNGTLVEAKIRTFKCPKCVKAYFSFNKCPIEPTTVQMTNLALTETKREHGEGGWWRLWFTYGYTVVDVTVSQLI